jgi:hypothetical protein
MSRRLVQGVLTAVWLTTIGGAHLAAHDGPPFPIVSDRHVGPYVVSLWTDPDTTDDGSAGGQFWLMVRPTMAGMALPADTRGQVVMRPLDREGPSRTGRTEPADGDLGRQFVALVMDHEGRFGISVSIEGSLGPASFESEVEGTYDARPAPAMLLLYLAPFVLVGGLWMRVMKKRRQGPGGPVGPLGPSRAS